MQFPYGCQKMYNTLLQITPDNSTRSAHNPNLQPEGLCYIPESGNPGSDSWESPRLLFQHFYLPAPPTIGAKNNRQAESGGRRVEGRG